MKRHHMSLRRFGATAIAALVAVRSFAQLTWDPVSGNSQIDGGGGTWDATTANWTSDGGVNNVVNSGAQAVFAGADGTHAVTLGANFSNQTLLRFSNSGYTLGATSARTLTGTSIWYIEVGSGKTATIGANVILTTASTSNPSLVLRGNGTLVLEDGALLRHTAANGRIQIGATLDPGHIVVNEGGWINAVRFVAVANGSLTLAGGTLNAVSSNTGTDAFQIGNVFATDKGTPVTVDLNAGDLIAVGTRDGVVFSIGGVNNTGVGGSLNLNGGTLTTTSIKAADNQATGTRLRVLNFNGGDLVISSAATQTQLDAFITGFNATHVASAVNILSGGARIDTGNINTGTTDGTATVVSVVRGAVGGAFTKLGANTLLLAAANTYDGETRVEGGTLKLGASGSIASSSGIRVSDETTFDVAAVTGGFTLGAAQTLGGNGTVAGPITLASGAKLALTLATPGNGGALAFTGHSADTATVVFNGNVVDITAEGELSSGTYGLCTFDAANAYSGTLVLGEGAESLGGASLSYTPTSIDLVVAPKATLITIR